MVIHPPPCEGAMRPDATRGDDMCPSFGIPEPSYVVVVRTEPGRTFRSVPFRDRGTAEQVARFSRLDREVIGAHVEKVSRRDGDETGGPRPC
jgi:hypothetical protein